MWFDLFWASKLMFIGKQVKGIKSYYSVWREQRALQKQLRPFCQGHPPEASNPVISQQLVGFSGSFCVFVFVCLCVCVSVCLYDNGKHYMVMCCWCHCVKVTFFISLCLFCYIDVNLLMSLYWYHSVDITLLMSLCWWKDMWLSNICITKDDWCIK